MKDLDVFYATKFLSMMVVPERMIFRKGCLSAQVMLHILWVPVGLIVCLSTPLVCS